MCDYAGRGCRTAGFFGRSVTLWGILLLFFVPEVHAGAGLTPKVVNLQQAVEYALEHSPRAKAYEAAVLESEGRVIGASVYPHNPELDARWASRSSQQADSQDVEVGISQELDLAGQRRNKMDVARSELRSSQAMQRRFYRILSADVHLAFLDMLEARELLELARKEENLARRLFELSGQRLSAGTGTQLDVNVAAAELARSRQKTAIAESDFGTTGAALAIVIGMPASSPPEPGGTFCTTHTEPPPLETLLVEAQKNRQDLLALRELELAARQRISLARSGAWPSLKVGVFAGREADTDTLVGGGIGFQLPLFQRNQGEIAESRAAAKRMTADMETRRLSIDLEVVAAYKRYHAGLKSVEALRQSLVGPGEESLELLRKSFEAGRTDWTEVLVMRRALFDARRALIEANANLCRDRVRISLAAGRNSLPDDTEKE